MNEGGKDVGTGPLPAHHWLAQRVMACGSCGKPFNEWRAMEPCPGPDARRPKD